MALFSLLLVGSLLEAANLLDLLLIMAEVFFIKETENTFLDA